jgi:hypothetical protein
MPRRKRNRAMEQLIPNNENVDNLLDIIEDFLARFQPQDRFETEFLSQMVYSLWQRQRQLYLEACYWNAFWNHSYDYASIQQDDFGAAVGRALLKFPDLLRVPAQLAAIQERHARSFHRAARSWHALSSSWPAKQTNPIAA